MQKSSQTVRQSFMGACNPVFCQNDSRTLSFHPIKLMAKKFPLLPKNPERICWGCDKYCPAESMCCGNGSERTQHPSELFGEDWLDWGPDPDAKPDGTGK